MGHQIIVPPLDHVAALYLNGHRVKLKIAHRNLSDSRCNGRCNSIGRRTVIGGTVGTPRANEECATDDNRKPADAEQPNPQCSLTGTSPVSFLLSLSIHVSTSFIAS